jgi:hypothetical protein
MNDDGSGSVHPTADDEGSRRTRVALGLIGWSLLGFEGGVYLAYWAIGAIIAVFFGLRVDSFLEPFVGTPALLIVPCIVAILFAVMVKARPEFLEHTLRGLTRSKSSTRRMIFGLSFTAGAITLVLVATTVWKTANLP